MIPADGAVAFGVAFAVFCTIPFPLVSFAAFFVAVEARHGIAQLFQLLFARVLYFQLRPLGHLSKWGGARGERVGRGEGGEATLFSLTLPRPFAHEPFLRLGPQDEWGASKEPRGLRVSSQT